MDLQHFEFLQCPQGRDLSTKGTQIMGGNPHSESMYEQIEDEDPKGPITTTTTTEDDTKKLVADSGLDGELSPLIGGKP